MIKRIKLTPLEIDELVSDESWKEQEREWNAHLASLEKPDKGGLGRNELVNLIDEHKKSLEEGQGNSSESTQRLRQILADSKKFDMSVRKLQEMWEAIDQLRYEPASEEQYRNDPIVQAEVHLDWDGPSRNNLCQSSAIEQFEWFTAIRRYPPPETVLAIGEIFRHYLKSKGELSLDQAFFGKPHKKKQSLAFNVSRDEEFQKFENEIFLRDFSMIKSDKFETREDIAKRLKGDDLIISPENYTRAFDMWRANKKAKLKIKETDKDDTEKKL